MSNDVLRVGIPRGAYAERDDPHLSWLDEMGERVSGLLLRSSSEGPARRSI